MNLNQVLIVHSKKVQHMKQFNGEQDTNNYRGTNLRGISKNGRCNWQILSMKEDQSKSYLGTVDNILKAAILYDISSIQTKGMRAKTNFCYSKREIYCVLLMPNLINIK